MLRKYAAVFANSGVLFLASGLGSVHLRERNPPEGPPGDLRGQNRRHVDEKASLIPFLSVSHRTSFRQSRFSSALTRTQFGSTGPKETAMPHEHAFSGRDKLLSLQPPADAGSPPKIDLLASL